MNLGLRIVVIIALQTAALLAMVGMKQFTLSTGMPIVLKTEPIDPRSLFRGDYVRLNYSISRLPIDKLAGDREFERGDTIYVLLRQQGEFWEAVSLHHVSPPLAAGQIAIKGRVEFINQRTIPRPGTPAEPGKSIDVKYGVENYFVPEGEGRALERPKPGETVSIRLVVDRYGNAAIKAVLVNGVERYVERVF
ncbi:MAG TPA: GDYXXLXY domain-containing protein [Acidiferrobacterales bacterium]|nr:GDYXXLXY domain-containing protein [Acidiferrobacterales bacterium]